MGITYEQMQSIIESVLVESGYYDMASSVRQRTLPNAPLGAAFDAARKQAPPL